MGNKIAKIRFLAGVLALIVAVCCCFTSCNVLDFIKTKTSLNDKTSASSEVDEAVAFLNKEITVAVGDKSELLVTGIDESNEANAKWSSSDTSIAKVENGVVTGVTAGAATVTVLVGSKSDTCIVRVIEGKNALQSKDDKDYDLATEYLSDEIYDWSIKEIQTSINLILARNHYKFKNEKWINYFEQFSWYYYDTSSMATAESRFNSIERANYNYLAKNRG